MFRPSVLTLQKPFDIPRNHLPPHRTGLAFAELFRDRNAITTGMLGNIHALVRLANDVLRGIAMHWETGDTEAELFRDRNAITTGMLGNIHALVRLANDVLRGIAMHWETGDTEAAGRGHVCFQ